MGIAAWTSNEFPWGIYGGDVFLRFDSYALWGELQTQSKKYWDQTTIYTIIRKIWLRGIIPTKTIWNQSICYPLETRCHSPCSRLFHWKLYTSTQKKGGRAFLVPQPSKKKVAGVFPWVACFVPTVKPQTHLKQTRIPWNKGCPRKFPCGKHCKKYSVYTWNHVFALKGKDMIQPCAFIVENTIYIYIYTYINIYIIYFFGSQIASPRSKRHCHDIHWQCCMQYHMQAWAWS